jgi:hypothetical protein
MLKDSLSEIKPEKEDARQLRWVDECDAQLDVLMRLAKFADHRLDCPVRIPGWGPSICICGYKEASKAVDEFGWNDTVDQPKDEDF